MHSITLGPDATDELRDTLGRFATGVTVVTVSTRDGPMGMTANSFTSVSLDPPLVLWCPARSSRRFAHFKRPAHFSIHVLGIEQAAQCRRFAQGDRGFAGCAPAYTPEGVPVLDDPLARFDCTLWDSIDAGDHAVVLGRVIRAQRRTGAPLVFALGGLGQFAPGD